MQLDYLLTDNFDFESIFTSNIRIKMSKLKKVLLRNIDYTILIDLEKDLEDVLKLKGQEDLTIQFMKEDSNMYIINID